MSSGLDGDDSIVGGSATTDVLTATVTDLKAATSGKLSISGVEEIVLTTSTTASAIDASGITGASALRFASAAGAAASSNSVDVTLTNLPARLSVSALITLSTDLRRQLMSLLLIFHSSDSLTVELGLQ